MAIEIEWRLFVALMVAIDIEWRLVAMMVTFEIVVSLLLQYMMYQ